MQNIEQFKRIIEMSSNGHFPLKYRIDLAKKLGVEITNKVFLECCKKAYVEFNLIDSVINQLLKLTEQFLYNNKNVDFKKLISKYKNYLETINNQQVAGVALGVLSLLNSLAYNAALILNIENYNNEDDDEFDWEEWNPDFILSNVYSEGNPFLGKGNSQKRKEFWFWYLGIVDTIRNNPNKIITTIQSELNDISGIIKREINPLINGDIRSKLEEVIKLVKNDIKDNPNWDKILIEGEVLQAGKSMRAHYLIGENSIKIPLTFFLYSGEKSSVVLMQQIKDIMYSQRKDIGAWMSYKIEINNNHIYRYYFNYDEYELLPEHKQRPDVFVAEFKSYPRAKSYTPKWLQKILENNNVSYL